MQALVQSVEAMVVALAAAAFAHFGVTLKEPPRPKADQVVRRIPASTASLPLPAARARPCPLVTDAKQV